MFEERILKLEKQLEQSRNDIKSQTTTNTITFSKLRQKMEELEKKFEEEQLAEQVDKEDSSS